MSNKFLVTGNGEQFVVDLNDFRVVQTPEQPIVIAVSLENYEKVAAEIYGEVPFPSPLPDDVPMPITMPHGGIPDFRYTPPSGKEHRRNLLPAPKLPRQLLYTPPSGKEHRRNRRAAARRCAKKKRNK